MKADINDIVNMMKNGVEQNLKNDGFVSMQVFLIKDKTFTALPLEILQVFNANKKVFYDSVRQIIKQFDMDYFVMVSEAWSLKLKPDKQWDGEMPSESKERVDTVFFTIDSRDRQISYMSEKNDGNIGKWDKIMDYDKTSPNSEAMGGLSLDLFGSGSNLGLADMPLGYSGNNCKKSKIHKIDK